MPVMWLPFYDFGGEVGVNAPNSTDEQLFVYLSVQLLPTLAAAVRKDPKKPASRNAPRVAAPRSDQRQWLDYLLTQLTPYGCPGPSPKVVPGPSSGPNGQIVRLMNRLFADINPAEFRNPSFITPALQQQGFLHATDLPMHMSKIESARSVWTGHIAKATGPRRELPFYDVIQKVGLQSVNFGPNSNGPSGTATTPDELLVATLLKIVFNGLAQMFPGAPIISPNAIVSLNTIPIFGMRVKELGWAVDDTHCVTPSGGSTNSLSLIRPLNYYAALANLTLYAKLSTGGAQIPSTLAQALQANTKNLWAQ